MLYYTNYNLCAPYVYESTSVMKRCIPSGSIPAELYNQTVSSGATSLNVANLYSQGLSYSTRAVSDLHTTWPLLVVCLATAIFLSIVWLYAAQLFIAPFIWLSILFLNGIMIVGTILLYFYYNSRKVAFNSGNTANGAVNITVGGYSFNQNLAFLSSSALVTQNDVNIALGIFVTVLVLTVLFLLVTLVMIKRVKMAIEIIKEASQAFRHLPGIQFLPLFFCVPMLAVFAYFVVIMMYLYSCQGTVTVSLLNTTYSNANNVYYMMWYHLAGFIWTYYTILGLCQLSVAGAVADWYWQLDKKAKLRAPVVSSFLRAIRYSLGSVILGSLLITIVELIRVYVMTLQRSVAKLKSKYLNFLVACAQCCLKCIQMVMKWINRHAYVYIAISGKGFFASAGAATSLLLRNSAKTLAVSYVGDFALLLTKLVVVGINVIAAYGFLAYNLTVFPNPIYDPTLTLVLVGVESFIIVSLFFSNYTLAIDTIFLSALEDLDKNDGSSARPYYMRDELKKILHKHNEAPAGSKVNQL
ncbi:hypothetical protein HDU91_004599 [Kappamyces sp. JEL0680]|nr:hypothetical protein HDU91_004599 [Kappamyces sp. JEL0680]